jgi:regulator of sigma E protease
MSFYYLQSAGAVLLTFGLVIFLHELGHFLMCRWLGVRVERFAFGMGPELVGITRGQTRYSICLFPLGGFVKPAGEEIEACSGHPDEYYGQPWYRRLAIVFSGPAMNYVLAFVLFTAVVWIKGMPEYGDEPVIGNMMVGFPADRAGIKVGDEILSFNDKPIATWKQLSDAVHAVPEQDVKVTFRRDGVERRAELRTKKDDATGFGVIGIMPKSIFKPIGLGRSLLEGVNQCYGLTAFTVKTIAAKIYHRQRPDLAGPVGIVQMVSRAAHSGWEDLIFLIGLISVAIGFFNLLPIPILDGGQAMMFIWEGISRRKLTTEIMSRANGVGIVLIVLLLLLATYSDVLRLRGERASRKAQPEQVNP